MEDKKFEIRNPMAKDIAPMARIISRIGVKEVSKAISPETIAAITGDEKQIGLVGVGVIVDVVGVVCENFDKAEDDLFSFMASMAGMKKSEIASLSIADAFELLYEIFTCEGFGDFFKRVQALLSE